MYVFWCVYTETCFMYVLCVDTETCFMYVLWCVDTETCFIQQICHVLRLVNNGSGIIHKDWWSDTDGKTKTVDYRDRVLHPAAAEWNSRFVPFMESLSLLHNCVSTITDVHCCVISGFHHEVGGNCAFQGCYAVIGGNLTARFSCNISKKLPLLAV